MAKFREKTSSAAPRQIAPPPLSQHLRELASRPDAWVVLARNLIPVVGIYGFGWSAPLALGAVFGDPSRLYEYDPGNPASSRQRR